jgi:hypothetical protein
MIRTVPAWGCKALDCAGYLSPVLAAAAVAQGYQAVARYLRHDGRVLDAPQPGGDQWGLDSLSERELGELLAQGLAVWTVQFGPAKGDSLNAVLGHQRGQAAVRAAKALGLQPQCHLWCDLEGATAEHAGAMGCAEYVEAWAAAVVASGYRAGLYEAGSPLDARGLYALRGVSAYWRSAMIDGDSKSPQPRGWSIVQRLPEQLVAIDGRAKIGIDPDFVRCDDRGGWFGWSVAS